MNNEKKILFTIVDIDFLSSSWRHKLYKRRRVLMKRMWISLLVETSNKFIYHDLVIFLLFLYIINYIGTYTCAQRNMYLINRMSNQIQSIRFEPSTNTDNYFYRQKPRPRNHLFQKIKYVCMFHCSSKNFCFFFNDFRPLKWVSRFLVKRQSVWLYESLRNIDMLWQTSNTIDKV